MPTDWMTTAAAASALGVARTTVCYYIRTNRIRHRHTFTREGRRTEVTLQGMRKGKLAAGDVANQKKCAECRQ